MPYLERHPEDGIVSRMSYRTELRRTAPATRYRGDCPECGGRGTLLVDDGQQKAWCRACGFEDSTAEYVAAKYGTDLKGAAEILNGRRTAFRPKSPPEVLEAACAYFKKSLEGSPAAAYLKKRGITDETARTFRLGYCPDGGELVRHLRSGGYSDEEIVAAGLGMIKDGELKGYFSKRLMIPISDRHSCTAGFGARILEGSGPKYINSPERDTFLKHRMLYAFDIAAGSGHADVNLVEGYMDAITLHQAGFSNTVAQMGTAFTPEHARLLKSRFRKVHICLDSDAAGRDAVSGVIKTLAAESVECDVVVFGEKDPDEQIRRHGKESFENAVNGAVTPWKWFVGTGDADWLINSEREVIGNGRDLWSGNAQGKT